MKLNISAIYEITHAESGRSYVGSSTNIGRRWKNHRFSLARGTHHAKHLQRAWNKYGAECFTFSIIEVAANPDDLFERETYFIEQRRAAFGVYNTAPVGGSTRGLKKGPMPPETRKRISASHTGIKPNEEARQRMSEAAKQRPPISEETRQKFVAHMTGRKMGPLSDAHRQAISVVHKGKTISEEHRMALSRAHKGRPLSEEHRRKKSEAAKLQHARRRAMQHAASQA